MSARQIRWQQHCLSVSTISIACSIWPIQNRVLSLIWLFINTRFAVCLQIEILTYCQLTSRQRLLYKALRNKISIEDLLQSSMGTAQQAHSTTSSLMNLVMQFRKVGMLFFIFQQHFDYLSAFWLFITWYKYFGVKYKKVCIAEFHSSEFLCTFH